MNFFTDVDLVIVENYYAIFLNDLKRNRATGKLKVGIFGDFRDFWATFDSTTTLNTYISKSK